MPLIGVGGATPFAMASNHPTAFNHTFRDEVGYNARAQVKMKCPSCGCWARRGAACYLCKTPVGGFVLPRHNNVKVVPSGDHTFTDATLGGVAPPTQHRAASRVLVTAARSASTHRSGSAAPPTRRPASAGGTRTASASASRPASAAASARGPATAATPAAAAAYSTSRGRPHSAAPAATPPKDEVGRHRYTAHAHTFRDTSSKNVAAALEKVKCRSCGCWAKRGKPCYLCHAVTH